MSREKFADESVDAEEEENLLEDIKAKLKDPYMMENKAKKYVGLALASRTIDIHAMLHRVISTDKNRSDRDFVFVTGLPAFRDFVEKLLLYLDEVYYIEKKRVILERENIKPQFLQSEKERLEQRTSECGQAYATILFHTVSRPRLNWEVNKVLTKSILQLMAKIVREAYKIEPNTQVVEALSNEVMRLFRTSSFHKEIRQKAEDLEKKKFRSILRDTLPKLNNLDGMKHMLELRRHIDPSVAKRVKDINSRSDHLPYHLKPAILQAKTSNSVLLNSLLSHVPDKRVAEHRMRAKSVEKEKHTETRKKIGQLICRDLDNKLTRNEGSFRAKSVQLN
jgi:hypothetical protein